MWYVLDKTNDIVVACLGSRGKAYTMRTQYSWAHPERKYQVMRGF